MQYSCDPTPHTGMASKALSVPRPFFEGVRRRNTSKVLPLSLHHWNAKSHAQKHLAWHWFYARGAQRQIRNIGRTTMYCYAVMEGWRSLVVRLTLCINSEDMNNNKPS